MRQGSRPATLLNTCRPLSFSRFQVSVVRRAKTMLPAASPCKAVPPPPSLEVQINSCGRKLCYDIQIPFFAANKVYLTHVYRGQNCRVRKIIFQQSADISLYTNIPRKDIHTVPRGFAARLLMRKFFLYIRVPKRICF